MSDNKLEYAGYEKNEGGLSYLEHFTVPDEEGRDIFDEVKVIGNIPYYYIDGKPHLYNRTTKMYTRVRTLSIDPLVIDPLVKPKSELEYLTERLDELEAKIDNITTLIERSVDYEQTK